MIEFMCAGTIGDYRRGCVDRSPTHDLFVNTRLLLNRCLSFVAFAGLLCNPVMGADTPTKGARPAIYDEKADGAEQIADALAVAKREDQRVLLQFGANWCGWCHKLHRLFASDEKIAAELKEAYVVVLINVTQLAARDSP